MNQEGSNDFIRYKIVMFDSKSKFDRMRTLRHSDLKVITKQSQLFGLIMVVRRYARVLPKSRTMCSQQA